MNDFRKITITYNYENDEISIHLSETFSELPLIHQADALKDAIGELTNIYHNKLYSMFKKQI